MKTPKAPARVLTWDATSQYELVVYDALRVTDDATVSRPTSAPRLPRDRSSRTARRRQACRRSSGSASRDGPDDPAPSTAARVAA